jgi:single-stranded-DNA-specific exonuclease
MALGIECLVTNDPIRAQQIASELDALNRERRVIEAGMQAAALASIADDLGDACALALFDPEWHQGVIGIVASRLKERFNRPVIAFARGLAGEIKGSGRSIACLHLRDALDLVSKRHPDLIQRFGGHAAAAGLTLRESDFERFRSAFEDTVRSLVTTADLERQIETDGSLDLIDATLASGKALAQGVWGQGFPEPRFFDQFDVATQKVVGGRHMKLTLTRAGHTFDAIHFGSSEPLPPRIQAIYALGVNEFNGSESLQLLLLHWHAAGD